jgi:hypothetical protein
MDATRRFRGFDLNAQDFLIHSHRFSLEELGAFLQQLKVACDEGNRAFLTSMPFVGRIYMARTRRYSISPWKRREVMERDGHACRSCGSRTHLEIDHVVAVAHGGSDEIDNLQTLCRTCNRVKGPQSHFARLGVHHEH